MRVLSRVFLRAIRRPGNTLPSLLALAAASTLALAAMASSIAFSRRWAASMRHGRPEAVCGGTKRGLVCRGDGGRGGVGSRSNAAAGSTCSILGIFAGGGPALRGEATAFRGDAAAGAAGGFFSSFGNANVVCFNASADILMTGLGGGSEGSSTLTGTGDAALTGVAGRCLRLEVLVPSSRSADTRGAGGGSGVDLGGGDKDDGADGVDTRLSSRSLCLSVSLSPTHIPLTSCRWAATGHIAGGLPRPP